MKITKTCPVCSSKRISKSPAVVMPFISYRIFGWEPVEISAEHNLRTLRTGTSYQICCSCFCHACDFVFTDLRFDEEELSRLYKDYRGAEYVTQRQMFEPDYISIDNYLKKPVKHLKEIEKFINSASVKFDNLLDWGGLDGKNTPFATSDLDVFLYDVANNFKNKTKNNVSKLGNLRGYENFFGLITMMHVLEHVGEPVDFLVSVSRYLSPNGLIYIEVPLEGIMGFEKNKSTVIQKKRHWHEHINFFSQKSLTMLLKASGLKLLKIQKLNVSDEFRNFQIQQVVAQKLS